MGHITLFAILNIVAVRNDARGRRYSIAHGVLMSRRELHEDFLAAIDVRQRIKNDSIVDVVVLGYDHIAAWKAVMIKNNKEFVVPDAPKRRVKLEIGLRRRKGDEL